MFRNPHYCKLAQDFVILLRILNVRLTEGELMDVLDQTVIRVYSSRARQYDNFTDRSKL